MMAEAMTNVESALAVGALGISQSSKLLGSILLGGSTSSADDDGQQKETLLEKKETSLQDEEGLKILKKMNEKLRMVLKYFSKEKRLNWKKLEDDKTLKYLRI